MSDRSNARQKVGVAIGAAALAVAAFAGIAVVATAAAGPATGPPPSTTQPHQEGAPTEGKLGEGAWSASPPTAAEIWKDTTAAVACVRKAGFEMGGPFVTEDGDAVGYVVEAGDESAAALDRCAPELDGKVIRYGVEHSPNAAKPAADQADEEAWLQRAQDRVAQCLEVDGVKGLDPYGVGMDHPKELDRCAAQVTG